MTLRFRTLRSLFGLTTIALVLSAGVVLAGPPLLCHPFDIGTAKSLTWNGSSGWMGRASDANLATLVADTEALLTPDTPVIVRMETLRRAGIYASRDEQVATRLLQRLQARAREAGTDPLATFDAGYLIETYRQLGGLRGERDMPGFQFAAVWRLVEHEDGYAMVQRSLAARANDPAIEFASALIAGSFERRRAEYAQHAQKARAGATQDALLARNLGHISGTR